MWLAAVRDAAIVLLALESVVIGVLLAVLLVQLKKLMRMLREEVAPILRSTNETVATVQSTTRFVSRNVVDPLVKVSSFSAGSLQALRSLFFVGQRVSNRRPKDNTDGSL